MHGGTHFLAPLPFSSKAFTTSTLLFPAAISNALAPNLSITFVSAPGGKSLTHQNKCRQSINSTVLLMLLKFILHPQVNHTNYRCVSKLLLYLNALKFYYPTLVLGSKSLQKRYDIASPLFSNSFTV